MISEPAKAEPSSILVSMLEASEGRKEVAATWVIYDGPGIVRRIRIELAQIQFPNVQRWILIGHSFGGMLASYYTSLHPQRVNKLVLSSSGGIDLTLVKGKNLINYNLSKTEIDSLNYWTNKIEKGDTTKIAKFKRTKSLAPAYVHNRKFLPVVSERLTQVNIKINNLFLRSEKIERRILYCIFLIFMGQ